MFQIGRHGHLKCLFLTNVLLTFPTHSKMYDALLKGDGGVNVSFMNQNIFLLISWTHNLDIK